MQILSSEQIRKWDEFTIQEEPISSIDLMERAAGKCFDWLVNNHYHNRSFSVFCGKGNNGGDGLAIARMLDAAGYSVNVFILEFGHKGTDDFQVNLARLHETKVEIKFIQNEENFHAIIKNDVIIDALLGSGLNRPLTGVTKNLVEHINQSGNEIVSIDIPSGLFADISSKGNTIIQATVTLSFQCYKIAFLLPENALFIGDVHILKIGLSQSFPILANNDLVLVEKKFVQSFLKSRNKFSHKGNFGHALLLVGSYGKIGAAVLAAKACLRSGVGLLTAHIPKCGYEIMQISIPEAMVSVDESETMNTRITDDISKYTTIGIGPGIGTNEQTKKLIASLLSTYKKPIVIDADALNIISEDKELFKQVSPYSIFTPHPKEFERLFGQEENDFARIESAQKNATALQCVIVLKGHYTFVALPDGTGYFNSTGNAGMAKGGSGDVLTGMATAFLAQGYPSSHAAILAVYLHGLAGDFAANYFSQQSMLATDIIDCIGQAVSSLS